MNQTNTPNSGTWGILVTLTSVKRTGRRPAAPQDRQLLTAVPDSTAFRSDRLFFISAEPAPSWSFLHEKMNQQPFRVLPEPWLHQSLSLLCNSSLCDWSKKITPCENHHQLIRPKMEPIQCHTELQRSIDQSRKQNDTVESTRQWSSRFLAVRLMERHAWSNSREMAKQIF